MFGFKRNNQQASGWPAAQPGIQLLASMLVCYPEIESVTYEPKNTELTMDFVISRDVAQSELEEFVKFLDESLQTYHSLETGQPVWLAAEAEAHGKTVMLHIHRQLMTMTRGELTLITALLQEHFGQQLKVDVHTPTMLEPDFSDVQSELLDQMLSQAQELRIRERMVGMRDNDKVVVYNR